LKEDISKVLVVFPEEWSRSKKQYVRLTLAAGDEGKSTTTTTSRVWLGRKYDFSPNGSKAEVEYGEDDITKLESAPDTSTLQVRSDLGVFRFEKKNGKWMQISEE
jgi:hypothetical protein